MTQEWKGEALVLRLGVFHEYDVWLKLLCKGYGLFTVFAFGGMRSIRRFCGCLDLLNTINCRIKASTRNNYLCLEEAALLDSPSNLRQNWQLAGIMANCMRFMEALAIDAENSIGCYDLLQEVKKLLALSKEPNFLLPFFFRLRLATLIGFGPDFTNCSVCNSLPGNNPVFGIESGRIYCQTCARLELLGKQAVKLTARSLEFLNIIKTEMPNLWPEPDLTWEEQSACKRLIAGFTHYHLGIAPGDTGFNHIQGKTSSAF